jgi:hypothetical protein
MKELIRVQEYVGYGGTRGLEWRVKLKGEEYGSRFEWDLAIPGSYEDTIVETFVRQMDDSIQKVLHGKTRTEQHMEDMKMMHDRIQSILERSSANL